MIRNIIFDFGDIFINLDKEAVFRAIEKYGGTSELTTELNTLNHSYEVGAISSDVFTQKLKEIYPQATIAEIVQMWNSILLDFPEYRLEFLEKLSEEKEYRLFLLSNTNDLHISDVMVTMGIDKYNRFKNSFEQFYLSHEINLRKPNANIYEFVLQQNGLKAEETFFIDDTKENTDAAKKLGITCWNLQVGKEDIIHLKTKI